MYMGCPYQWDIWNDGLCRTGTLHYDNSIGLGGQCSWVEGLLQQPPQGNLQLRGMPPPLHHY